MLADKLKELRKSKGITQVQFAHILNVANGTVGNWEAGNRQPDNDMLVRIADYYGVSADYLLGRDPISISKNKKGIRIPVIGISAAGIPLEIVDEYSDDDPDSWEEISEHTAATGNYVAIKIKGDSMEPPIGNGDIVIVRVQDDADSGDIAIMIVNGNEATCKKIKKRPEGIMLISNNPTYEPMFYSNKEIIELPVRCFGKVVESRRKF